MTKPQTTATSSSSSTVTPMVSQAEIREYACCVAASGEAMRIRNSICSRLRRGASVQAGKLGIAIEESEYKEITYAGLMEAFGQKAAEDIWEGVKGKPARRLLLRTPNGRKLHWHELEALRSEFILQWFYPVAEEDPPADTASQALATYLERRSRRRVLEDSAKFANLCSVGARLNWLAKNYWGSEYGAMAAALKISLRDLNNLVIDYSAPDLALYNAIAKVKSINLNWVLTGEGDPFRYMHAAVPIFDRLVVEPGDLSTATGELTLPPQWHSSTRYLYAVGADAPITRSSTTKVLAGDLLLIETDINSLGDVCGLDGRMAVVCGSTTPMLATILAFGDEHHIDMQPMYYQTRPSGPKLRRHRERERWLDPESIKGIVLQLIRQHV